MVSLNTLYDDMHNTLHWSNSQLYSKHYKLPDAEAINNVLRSQTESEAKPPGVCGTETFPEGAVNDA